MKRRAIVAIDVDTDGKPESSSTAHKDVGDIEGVPATGFIVNIRPSNTADDPKSVLSMRTSLAHELGHIVAYIAGTEANQNDPRSKPVGNRWTENPAEAVIASETEASEIAKEIDPGIDAEETKRNLESYSKQKEELNTHLQIAMLLESLGRASKTVH